MAPSGLIDTGAIVALLSPSDPWHALCREALQHHLRLPLLTSEAVLTEVFHFTSQARHGMEKTWALIRSGAILLATISGEELPELCALMRKYSDRPMDFADATLVHLARRESLTTIFTTDYSDFDTYRIEGKRKFRIVPSQRP